MGLEITSNQMPSVGAQSRYFLGVLQKYVDAQKTVCPAIKPDTVSINTDLYKYLNANAIAEMVKINAEIKRILEEFKLPIKINMSVLHNLIKNHLPQTKKAVVGIANNLPQDLRESVNMPAIQKAAVLHDCGKVLIPEKILNKQGVLNEKERAIMEKHAILGYEMLKGTDLDEETLKLVRNHHQNAQKSGYPKVEETYVSDINSQILSAADIYSALREKRSYKKEMGKNQALSVMHKEMQKGNIHPHIFKALVDYANQEEKSAQIKPQRKISNFKLVNCLST